MEGMEEKLKAWPLLIAKKSAVSGDAAETSLKWAAPSDSPWCSAPCFASCACTQANPVCSCAHIHMPNQGRKPAPATHQRKVVRVDPHNAQVRIISVVPGNLLQDFQELKAVWKDRGTSRALSCKHPATFACGVSDFLHPLWTQELFIILIKMLSPHSFFW